jgi:ATP-dependent DNA ligase
MIVTTRRLDELQAQATEEGISFSESAGREELMDLLRESLGAANEFEIDPMKCADLKNKISWEKSPAEGRYAGIAQYLTNAWVAELKLDGARMRLFVGITGNTLNSGRRSVKTFGYTNRTENFPHLKNAFYPKLAGVILDGEILAATGQLQTHTGTWTDSLLNASVAIVNSKPAGSIETQLRFGLAEFHAFDVLAAPNWVTNAPDAALSDMDSVDLRDKPYEERREILARIVGLLHVPQIKLVPQVDASVEAIEKALGDGFEGVILKNRVGVYEPGKRSKNWQKVKTFSSADAFIVGFSPGENKNLGLVGSLDLAVAVPAEQNAEKSSRSDYKLLFQGSDGGWFSSRAVAQVGNLTDAMRHEISDEHGNLKQEYYGLVIEFLAQGLGKNGRARHGHMTRVRPDKSPEECLEEQLDAFPRV